MREGIRDFEDMNTRLTKILRNRRIAINPFKLDPYKHIYVHVMTKKQWAAYTFLHETNSRFHECTQGTSTVFVRGTPSPARFLRVGIPEAQNYKMKDQPKRFPDIDADMENLPPKVQEYITKWLKRDKQILDQNNDAHDRFIECGVRCNTWGQLARVWPNIKMLFPPRRRDKAIHAKARSRLPEAAFDADGKLIEAFDPDGIAEAELVIAEALMLPDTKEDGFPYVNYE